MAPKTTDIKHKLTGDWTISGVVSQVDSLSKSLHKLAAARRCVVNVDCAGIEAIDMSGLQLLHVWMECASVRGIRTKLVNLSDEMDQTIQRLGLGHCFTDNYPDAA